MVGGGGFSRGWIGKADTGDNGDLLGDGISDISSDQKGQNAGYNYQEKSSTMGFSLVTKSYCHAYLLQPTEDRRDQLNLFELDIASFVEERKVSISSQLRRLG
jgi:hypothetical protein